MRDNANVYDIVNCEEYSKWLWKAKVSRGESGLMVSEVSPYAANGMILFLSPDGLSGFGLHPTGDGEFDMVHVFSHADVKGRLPEMVAMAEAVAIANGAISLSLDCFAPLVPIYSRFGFLERDRVSFDWEYAPEGWSEDMGEPDVVFMAKSLSVMAIAAE